MTSPTLSIVTPTFNREGVVSRALDSSLELIKQGFAQEIILVDDASTDNTVSFIKNKYRNELESGKIKFIELEQNVGVTGAKNAGARLAQGDWIAFMDSDDIFLKNSGEVLVSELIANSGFSLFYFRCSDLDSGKLIGQQQKAQEISISELLNGGTPGECLPVMKSEVAKQFPYNESLRGCESLSYLKLASEGYNIFLSDKIVRGYDSSGDDRLSTKKAIKNRADKLLKYHFKTLQFAKYATLTTFFGILFRIAYYSGVKILK
ncbi:glycosyltransferase family 2 protein [Pseudoalteromonas sp. MMG013]|uniref:glycosyltransferase family 2 protein n=1 Tax=Pseudoalteromonas sp. MMG013 TaxID=2822687 RepID=UPI001B39478C|nr:glycosyltransferase family 2 protein [Pseudoalteromonas sp. MMG013]